MLCAFYSIYLTLMIIHSPFQPVKVVMRYSLHTKHAHRVTCTLDTVGVSMPLSFLSAFEACPDGNVRHRVVMSQIIPFTHTHTHTHKRTHTHTHTLGGHFIYLAGLKITGF